ncbi:hypothetical protein GCM10025882_23040 [Acinetobacter gyllenbergii]|uniref:Major facilitator superfamily (MFS) profile domain-containing protein n=1 Tax=Acinetobacter gyllenbergii CIP 110306 = MTCC 11365 TaxID=1217657 RepID=A0A829HKU6_9GAMM|nr:hypothetical protein [Acinetobacter gyllenbergii]EPF93348.1 hypothetical protein F957_00144 [Acinetobacter gyllenbergii CIP 110306 = MTCC 11365]EPH32373.1 hypothetical protein L293_1466 [Acinetobacter gyllenbergii CIP 110306 = MTCC 11365]OBY75645.1 hypothetical protein NG55_02940 [Acinetobacter gyllenbergii]GMA11879.1 hypothetical protein GCM10025882_23040 [Acinetobacter gyllenbergii]
MLTILAEVIVAFFVSNYKSEEYPYLTSFVKGMVIGFFAFVIGNILDLIKGNLMSFPQQVLFFLLSFGLGLIMFLFFSLFRWLERTDFGKK